MVLYQEKLQCKYLKRTDECEGSQHKIKGNNKYPASLKGQKSLRHRLNFHGVFARNMTVFP